MSKKNLIWAGALACVCTASLALSSCGGDKNTTPTVTNAEGKEVALPIAYVRMDSVLSEYTFSKEIQTKLQADADAGRTRLQGRAAAFQKAAEDFERRMRINAFVSEDAAKAEQQRVLKLQQDAAGLEQQITQELAQKQALMQEDLMKEIEKQLKEFNGGRFKLILSNVGVLYADDALDITADFIKHLNATYKPGTAKVDSTKTK